MIDRRSFLQSAAAVALAVPMTASCAGRSRAAGYLQAEPQRAVPVTFPSGGGTVAGHLYQPAAEGLRPAVVVGGSLTAVKEQMGGIYAARLAERGIAALSIDYRNYGASTGSIRQYEDPIAKAVDLSSAMSYLASRPDVDEGRLGLLGICTSGGTVLYAAAADPRVRAVASVAGHLAEPAVTPSLYGGPEGVRSRQSAARSARADYERSGTNPVILAYSDVDQRASHPGPNEYYMDEARGGGVSQWRNEFAVMSWEPWLAFDPIAKASSVAAPALVVHSDDCALPAQARKVYDRLAGPKSLHWTAGPHFEFYDGPTHVTEAVDVVARHFTHHLA